MIACDCVTLILYEMIICVCVRERECVYGDIQWNVMNKILKNRV